MPLIDPVTMSGNMPGQSSLKASASIDILPTEVAQIFTPLHPIVLLSAYYLRFPALVADPKSTLLNTILPLGVIQIAYAVMCLPYTGSDAKTVKKTKSNASKKQTPNTLSTKAFIVFFALLLSLLSVPLLAAIQILFGAPVTTHIPHTFLSSAHIALLAVFPLIYTHGADGAKWREIVSLYSPVDEIFGAAVGCFLGAWIGAVPIPLDWDREWQKWPVTIVSGAYAGYAVGKLAGGTLLKGKRIEFD